jgi:hypothetical protein
MAEIPSTKFDSVGAFWRLWPQSSCTVCSKAWGRPDIGAGYTFDYAALISSRDAGSVCCAYIAKAIDMLQGDTKRRSKVLQYNPRTMNLDIWDVGGDTEKCPDITIYLQEGNGTERVI